MTYFQIATLFIFLLPLAYSPGPGNIAFAAAGASSGFKSTLMANLGYHIATFAITLTIGLSYNRLFSASDMFIIFLTYMGAGYVFYLGFKFLMASQVQFKLNRIKLSFLDGIILLITNPKAYFIIALMFSQFTPNVWQNDNFFIIAVCILFTLNNCIAFIIWSVAGAAITVIFDTPKSQKIINSIFGLMLILVAIGLVFK